MAYKLHLNKSLKNAFPDTSKVKILQVSEKWSVVPI